MLALTECHQREGIKAAVLGNPIVDWIALDSALQADGDGKRPGKKGALAPPTKESQDTLSLRKTLIRLRGQYFTKPEKYFDPFASPLLFFRTPRATISDLITASEESEAEIGAPDLVRRRLSHRAYPPLGSGLILPRMRIEVGDESPARDQGLELVHLMERSLKKETEARLIDERNRFEIVSRPGIGLWKDADLLRIGQWFGEVLRSP